MACWSGGLLRALLIIFRILAFTLSEKRSHWRVLSKVTLLFLYFRRMTASWVENRLWGRGGGASVKAGRSGRTLWQ